MCHYYYDYYYVYVYVGVRYVIPGLTFLGIFFFFLRTFFFLDNVVGGPGHI